MKKLLVTGVAAAVLLGTGAGLDHQAEAAKANINYLSPSVVKKAKAGTLTMDGYKIGAKAGVYAKSKKYYNNNSKRMFWQQDNSYSYWYDIAFVDMQNSKKVSSTNRTITRIVDKQINAKRKITQDDIRIKYGKPLRSATYNNSDKYEYSRKVDVYKYVTFFYVWKEQYDVEPLLNGAVIMHNKTNASLDKWLHYAENEANMDVEEMNDYISSTDWASY